MLYTRFVITPKFYGTVQATFEDFETYCFHVSRLDRFFKNMNVFYKA